MNLNLKMLFSLQENLELLKGDAEKAGLKINIGKTKTMVFGKESL